MNNSTICRICGNVIFNPKRGQKYHAGRCKEVAHELAKIRNFVVSKVDGMLS